jgi:hypothetical protein
MRWVYCNDLPANFELFCFEDCHFGGFWLGLPAEVNSPQPNKEGEHPIDESIRHSPSIIPWLSVCLWRRFGASQK